MPIKKKKNSYSNSDAGPWEINSISSGKNRGKGMNMNIFKRNIYIFS